MFDLSRWPSIRGIALSGDLQSDATRFLVSNGKRETGGSLYGRREHKWRNRRSLRAGYIRGHNRRMAARHIERSAAVRYARLCA